MTQLHLKEKYFVLKAYQDSTLDILFAVKSFLGFEEVDFLFYLMSTLKESENKLIVPKFSSISLKNFKVYFCFRLYYLCLILQFFFILFNQNTNLKNFNVQLINKIYQLRMQLRSFKNEVNEKNSCLTCSEWEVKIFNIKGQIKKIYENYSVCQAEKERMVIKYATSEKHCIEAQRSLNILQKKNQNLLRENNDLNKKIQKAHSDVIKLNTDLNNKCLENECLQKQIIQNKKNYKSLEINLKWTQDKLKHVLSINEDTQKKLNEISVHKSQTKNIESEISTFNDSELEKKSSFNEMQTLHRPTESEHFDLPHCTQHIDDDQNNCLVTPTTANNERKAACVDENLIKDEDLDCHLKQVNLLLEKEKKKVLLLKKQLTENELLREAFQCDRLRLINLDKELQCIRTEKEELLSAQELFQKNEIQFLDITQKLTDKNVKLQCELTELQSKYTCIINKLDPLNKIIKNNNIIINNLKQDIIEQKKIRQQESDYLAKCIAEEICTNRKLLWLLENLQEKNIILNKKREYAVKEMNRELNILAKQN